MNMLLWGLQILFALWMAVGAGYMMTHYRELANASALSSIPEPAWLALGVLQIAFAIGLVLPTSIGVPPMLAPLSAVGLAVISLLGLVLYTAYAGFPGAIWAVLPAVLAAAIAYARWR